MTQHLCVSISHVLFLSFNFIASVMSTNQVVMLHVALSVSRVGSVTYYLPVLVVEGDEDEEDLGPAHQMPCSDEDS